MKVVNKTDFEVEALPFFGPDNSYVLTIIAKATFAIEPDMSVVLAEEQLSLAYADEFFEDAPGVVRIESDVAPFKPASDIALIGRAYAPDGKPVTNMDVRLRVGSVSKTIRVSGNRKWSCGGRLLPAAYSSPKPFQKMDLSYARAYGGVDEAGGDFCKENPAGLGFFARKTRDSINEAPAPNLEDPNKLIKSWKDRPEPASFGFRNRAWEPRLKYMGTFDKAWQKERSPLPPLDFDFRYHNAAHPDLQVKGYLRGDEEVKLHRMTTAGPLGFKLPGHSPTCRVDVRPDPDLPETESQDVVLNLDTLCLMPDEMKFYQVWRGTIKIADLSAEEIADVVVDLY